MEPLLAESASLKVKVVDLKEHLKRLKKVKADEKTLEEIDAQIRAKEKEAHDLEAQAASLDARLFFYLKAVNPNATMTVDGRAPAEIILSIQEQGRIVSEALKRLNALTTNPEARIRHSEVPRQVVDS